MKLLKNVMPLLAIAAFVCTACQKKTEEDSFLSITQNEEYLAMEEKLAEKFTDSGVQLQYAAWLFDHGYDIAAFYRSEYVRGLTDNFNSLFEKNAVRPLKSTLSPDTRISCLGTVNEAKEIQKRMDAAFEEPDPHPAIVKILRSLSYAPASKYADIIENLNPILNSKKPEDIRKVTDAFAAYAADPDLNETYEFLQLASNWMIKMSDQKVLASKLYIRLYFAFPHYYDWEYAEYRIRSASGNNKEHWFDQSFAEHHSDQKKFVAACAFANPRLIDVLLMRIEAGAIMPDPAALFMGLRSPDMHVQSASLHTLRQKCDLKPYRQRIDDMLAGKEGHMMQAMALFLMEQTVEPERRLAILAELSNSRVDIVRIDATNLISTLSKADQETVRKIAADQLNVQGK